MTEPTVTQHDRDAATKWLYGAHLERWDLNGDPVDRLAELLARVRAEAEAAMLLAAAAQCESLGNLLKHAHEIATEQAKPGLSMQRNVVLVLRDAIKALQSSDAAAALARRDAETRLNEAKNLQYKNYVEVSKRIAELTRQLDEAKAPKEGR
jgi:hypothetical protein